MCFVVMPIVASLVVWPRRRPALVRRPVVVPQEFSLDVPPRPGPDVIQVSNGPALRYSDADWLPIILSIPDSKILARVRSHVLANVAVACVVALAQVLGFCAAGSLALHTLLGGAMSLLLVFRTNAAYDRFWEARRAWGRVLTAARELARNARFLRPEARRELAAALCAYPHLLRLRVTNRPRAFHTDKATAACLNAGMASHDVERVVGAKHRPLECLNVMAAAIREDFLAATDHDPYQRAVERQLLEAQLRSLNDSLGTCERILNSPIPLSYSRHTSRFLSLWLATLPLAIDAPALALPLIAGATSWALLSIQEIGHVIEEPFNSPFDSTCNEGPNTSLGMDLICAAVSDEVAAHGLFRPASPTDHRVDDHRHVGGFLATAPPPTNGVVASSS